MDFEEFLNQHFSAIFRDPLRSILDFPPNDVQIKIIKRSLRTLDYVRPKDDVAVLPNYVRHCLDCFTRNWKVVEFSHRLSARIERAMMSVSVYQQEFEVDQDFSSLDDTLVYQVRGAFLFEVFKLKQKNCFFRVKVVHPAVASRLQVFRRCQHSFPAPTH